MHQYCPVLYLNALDLIIKAELHLPHCVSESMIALALIVVLVLSLVNQFDSLRLVRSSAIGLALQSGLVTKRKSFVLGAKVETATFQSLNSQLSNWLSNLMFWNKQETIQDKREINALVPSKKAPTDATIVFGATGKTGEKIVRKLMQDNGKQVVIAARNETKAREMFSDCLGKDNVFLRGNIDITDKERICADLFDGVTQIVCATGPLFNNPEYNSENVDYKATVNIINQFKLTKQSINAVPDNAPSYSMLVSFSKKTGRDLTAWSRLDDVIMGGSSYSSWQEVDWAGEGSDFCRWTGNLIVTGGGFCGTVIREKKFATEGYDGIKLRVRGDGNRYKVLETIAR